MRTGVVLGLLLLLFGIAFASESHKDKPQLLRTCYYIPYQSPPPDRLNATLCTHIMLGFASIQNGLLYLNESRAPQFFDALKLKESNPELKILLSVGGGGENAGFPSSVNSTFNRTRLIFSIASQLLLYGFDGLDIDWEFPVWNDAHKEDKENFVTFLQEFKLWTPVVATTYKRAPLLLTVAVAAPQGIIDAGYDVSGMAKYVDFINLMSYDYHDYFWYTPFTGYNSPLYSEPEEKGYFATLNTAWSANYWHQLGMPKSKIMVGIPTYSHGFRLADRNRNGVNAPSTGSIPELSFSQICKFIASGGIRVFDNDSAVPYVYKGYEWHSYDDQQSVEKKAQWIVKNDFGGAMTYNLNNDDWSGSCSDTPFPLHNIIYKIFTR